MLKPLFQTRELNHGSIQMNQQQWPVQGRQLVLGSFRAGRHICWSTHRSGPWRRVFSSNNGGFSSKPRWTAGGYLIFWYILGKGLFTIPRSVQMHMGRVWIWFLKKSLGFKPAIVGDGSCSFTINGHVLKGNTYGTLFYHPRDAFLSLKVLFGAKFEEKQHD